VASAGEELRHSPPTTQRSFSGRWIAGSQSVTQHHPHLRGDGLDVVSVALFAGYTLLGRRLRPHLPNATYAATVYAVAGVVCLLVLVALGLPVVRYSNRDWLCFILMALIPTGIGHTALNHALRYLSAARLSVLNLTEPALAGLVAYEVWGEPITAAMLVGFALIALAVVTLASESWTQKSRAARLQQQ
jgi:drug/metabolite transporter (DMT)-like permease